MGNSLEKGLGSDEELEVRASVVIRKKKNERIEVERSRKPEVKDQVSDDPGFVGDGNHRGPRAVKDEDDDDHQEEKFQEEAEVALPKQRRAKIKIRRSRAPAEIRDRPLSSGSKVSGEDNYAPAKKKIKGNSGRPSSVTICSDSDNPGIDIRISRSHLFPAFTLSLPPAFVRDNMDLETQYRVLHGGSCQHMSVCVSGRRFMVKRQQWKAFVEEHSLRAGDMVHLEVSSSKQELKLEIFRNKMKSQGIVYDEDPIGSDDFEEELLEDEEEDEEEEPDDDATDGDDEDEKERERERDEIQVLGSTKRPKSKKGMVPVPVY